MLQTAASHPKLRIINIFSLGAIIALNIFMLIAWAGQYFVVFFISLSSILFILNILFYVLGEEQRQLIVRYRVFSVYIISGLVILLCLVGLIQWIVNGPMIIFHFGQFASWLFSVLWLLAKLLQATTFTLMVNRASEIIAGTGASLLPS